jgi:hypothetical protein
MFLLEVTSELLAPTTPTLRGPISSSEYRIDGYVFVH